MANTATPVQVSYEELQTIADSIVTQAGGRRPRIGIVCGSGLGSLAEVVEDKTVIPYTSIPHFPVSTVVGHEGKLIVGTLGGKEVVLMKGRSHCYEGYPAQQTAVPVRVMKLMGVNILLVTNAAGGINPDFKVGDIMIIKDHMNLAGFSGVNPLVGKNDERFGERFPPMSNAYDLQLRQAAKSQAQAMGFQAFVREGVYSMMVGPNFETPTECRFLRMVGVDATGMSTIPEVLVARQCGLRVLGFSLITNMVVMDYDVQVTANHEEVLATGKARSKDMKALVAALMANIDV